MNSDELKLLIKTQQQMIKDQEKRYDMALKTSISRPKTAGTQKRTKTSEKSFNRDISPSTGYHQKGK